MHWATALHDIIDHRAADCGARAALARDTVYLPSEVAARLLPRDASVDLERVVGDVMAPATDRRSPDR